MTVTASSDAIDASPSSTSLSGLDGVNLFLAGMQSGFGPFVAVLLADEKWTLQNIGFVLSASSLAGLLSQLPGGELLDATRSKRFLVALGGIMVAVSRTLAKSSSGLCCPGAARNHRRVSWAGNRCYQPRLGRSLGSCRSTWTQSTLRVDRSRYDHRAHGRHRLFSVVSSDIPRLCRTRASDACSSSPYPFDRYPLRPCLRPTRSRRTHTARESTALEPLEESQPAHVCRLLVFISARERLYAATRR